MFGGIEEFDALAFGEPHPNSVKFFQSQYQDIVQNAQNFVGDLGKRFVQTATNIYQNYVSPEALARVRNILHHVKINNDLVERITELIDIQQMQKANLTMQRWIMANPMVRSMYNEQKLDGYSDTYIDVEPNTCGLDNYDYRMATEGMLQITYDEKGEPDGTLIRQYFVETELRGNDRLLAIDEKADILSTWDAIEAILKLGKKDPTSVVNGYL